MDERKPEKMEEGNENKYQRQRTRIPVNIAENWFRHFQYDPNDDKPGEVRNILLIIATLIAAITFTSEVRNILLIIATLIATITFQAGVNPPIGIWQDNDDGHTAGRAIYASHHIAFYVFLVSQHFCALHFSTFHRLSHLQVPTPLRDMGGHGLDDGDLRSAIFAVTPSESVRFRYVLIAGALPVIGRCICQMFGKLDNGSKQPPDNESQQRGAPENARG